jgi:hypothetical protein
LSPLLPFLIHCLHLRVLRLGTLEAKGDQVSSTAAWVRTVLTTGGNFTPRQYRAAIRQIDLIDWYHHQRPTSDHPHGR